MKVWARNNSGNLVAAIDVADMDEAQRLAAQWNKTETRPNMRVHILANAEKAAWATKVRAVY